MNDGSADWRMTLLARLFRPACLAAVLCAPSACEGVPDLMFASRDADVEASFPGSPSIDAAAPEASAQDSGLPAPDAGDGGDENDAQSSCLPPSPPPNAGCCPSTIACIGLGCSHCADCAGLSAQCQSSEFCCAHVAAQGTYLGVVCSPDGKNCP